MWGVSLLLALGGIVALVFAALLLRLAGWGEP